MKSLHRCTGLCSIVLALVGCHSSSTPVSSAPVKTASVVQPVAQIAQPAPVTIPPAAPKKLVCKGKSVDGMPSADFVQMSPLYPLMDSKLGGWSSCVTKDEETDVTFVGGATLSVFSSAASDSGGREAVLPAGTSITREDVLKALKADVPDGCGVAWSKLSAGGPGATGDYKVSGTICSVDIHVKMLRGSVVGFGFIMAA